MNYNNRCGRGEQYRGHTYCEITGCWCGFLSDDHENLQKNCEDFKMENETQEVT